MTCPFKVGDRIHEARAKPEWLGMIDYARDKPVFEPDTTKPDATVTTLTARGFEYRYDYPIMIGRVEWDQQSVGGECYEEGFHLWRKTSAAPVYTLSTTCHPSYSKGSRWWMWNASQGWVRWQAGWGADNLWTHWSPDAETEPPRP